MLVGGEAAGRARWAALEQGPLARHAHTLADLHQREPKINIFKNRKSIFAFQILNFIADAKVVQM
jgi:hypothetical protein